MLLIKMKLYGYHKKEWQKFFECFIDNISLHFKHIFENNKLDKKAVTEKSSLTADDGTNYNTIIYSLDAIIAINSKKATIIYNL